LGLTWRGIDGWPTWLTAFESAKMRRDGRQDHPGPLRELRAVPNEGVLDEPQRWHRLEDRQ
jgi:hypothetical protein